MSACFFFPLETTLSRTWLAALTAAPPALLAPAALADIWTSPLPLRASVPGPGTSTVSFAVPLRLFLFSLPKLKELEGGGVVPTRPIAGVPPSSVNQRLPSTPAAIPTGSLPALSPALNPVICPVVVISPIAGVLPPSANQRLPSGPAAISSGSCHR